MSRHLLAAALAAFLLGCSDDDDGDGAPAPLVQLSPSPGAYPQDVTVTLSTGRPATILYTLDGRPPVPGDPNTHSAPAPVRVELTADPGEQIDWVLRFSATGPNGDVIAAERSVTYRIDEKDPTIASDPVLPRIGILESAEIRFTVDEPVVWRVVAGEGDGALVLDGAVEDASGTAVAEIPGAALPARAVDVPVVLTVTDVVQRSARREWRLSQDHWIEVPVLTDVEHVDLSPDGTHAWLSGSNRFLSVNLADAQVVRNVPLPAGVAAQEVAGDFAWLAAGEIVKIDPATGDIVKTLQADGAVTALAATPDGARVYYSDLAGVIGFVDTSDDSLRRLTAQAPVQRSNMHFLPDARMLIYAWQSQGVGLAEGVRTFDLDTGRVAPVPVPSTRFVVPVESGVDWIYVREPEVASEWFVARYRLDGTRLAHLPTQRTRLLAAAPMRTLLAVEPGTSLLEIRFADDLALLTAYPLTFGAQGGARAISVVSHAGNSWLFWLGVDRVLRVVPLR